MSDESLESFKRSFKGDIILPSDSDYATAIARWAKNAVRKAKIVAYVKDAEDVALALKYAKDNKLPIAIKCGGHSASGASSSEDGIVIDLSRYLNVVKVNPECKTVTAGGGTIWGDIDKAAMEHGLATVSGTVYHTGVGGLTLGGGLGFLSARHGMVIDNLLQVTIVTANGSKLVANKDDNPDLFWGVRGGGGNFGVVTEFVYRLHDQRPTVYAGVLFYPASALRKIADHVDNWFREGPTDNAAVYYMLTRGPDGNPTVGALVFYNGSEAEGRVYFKALLDLKPALDQTREMPFEEVNRELVAPFFPHGIPTYLKGTSLMKYRFENMEKAFNVLLETTANTPNNMRATLVFEYMSLAAVNKAPNNETAFVRRGNPLTLCIIRWDEGSGKEGEQNAREIVHRLVDIIGKGNVDEGDEINIGYGNYDAEGSLPEDVDGYPYSGKAAALYGENYPRLQALKKKYDPDITFSKWFVITPAE